MKKIIMVAFEVDTNMDRYDLLHLDGPRLAELIGSSDISTASFDLVPFDVISIHDTAGTTVKEKADADQSGTTTGTPEFDEGPTG